MFKYKHIIVLYDSAEDCTIAVDKASQLARLSGSKLTLFACDYNSSLTSAHPHTENAQDAFLTRLKDSLEPLAEVARKHNINVVTDAVWDKHSGSALMAYLTDNPADMIVKATHHQNVIQRTFFSQTDWELIRNCPVPLLLTKGNKWQTPMTITAAVDPVRTNDKPDFIDDHIIGCGTKMRSLTNANLGLLHVYDPTPLMIYLDQPAINSADMGEEIRVQHSQALLELADKKDIDKEHTHLEMGSPVQVIPDFLYENNIDMVIMGAVSRSGIERWLLGHTAEKVLDRISVDILIAK